MGQHDDDDAARVQDAHAFLTALYGVAPAGSWVGVMRKADGRRGVAFGRGEWRSVEPVYLSGRAAVAVRWRSDVYVNVAPCAVEPPKGKRNTTATTAALVCLWHELDGDDAAERLAMLEAEAGRASVVVASGGGLHAYWLLAAPVVGAEAIRGTLAAWRARIVAALGDDPGDAVQDAARILRVPGTFNAKPERRDAAGNAPAVTLLRCDSGQRYAAAELAPPLPDVEPQPAAARPSGPRPAHVTPYGAGALASACLEIAERKPNTGRWVDMRRQVFRLGQIAECHGLDADAVAADIMRACDVNGLIDEHGAASVRRTISAAWAAGLAAPSDRGTSARTSTAWAQHGARVDGWAAPALALVRLRLPVRTRDVAAAVVDALLTIARAAGPPCSDDGFIVIDASRDRLAILTGHRAQTCRDAIGRLEALGIVEVVKRGGLLGYRVRVRLACKAANTYRLKRADALDAAAPAPVRHKGNDALTARFGPKGAAILRALLDADGPLTSRELAARVGCSRPTADEHVGRLVSAGAALLAGERPNRKGPAAPLYGAAVASVAEAIAVSGAEDAQARLLARRAAGWSDMTARANATAGHYQQQRELEDAIGQGVARPDGVAAFAAELRSAPLSDGAIIAGKRAADTEEWAAALYDAIALEEAARELDELAAQHAEHDAPAVEDAADAQPAAASGAA